MNNQTKKSASVVLDSISKSYKNGNIELQVLKNLNLRYITVTVICGL